MCSERPPDPASQPAAGATPASSSDAPGGADGKHGKPKTKIATADVEHAAVQKAQEPVPIPDVPIPSPAEVARHNLTHLPYKKWVGTPYRCGA